MTTSLSINLYIVPIISAVYGDPFMSILTSLACCDSYVQFLYTLKG